MDTFETWYSCTLTRSGVDEQIDDPTTVVHIVSMLEAAAPDTADEPHAA